MTYARSWGHLFGLGLKLLKTAILEAPEVLRLRKRKIAHH